MNKKEVQLITECLETAKQAESKLYRGTQQAGINLVISVFADRLAQESERFNRGKFIAATTPKVDH